MDGNRLKRTTVAFYKRGVPACFVRLYVDNGSIYTSKEIIQICARVGCLLAQANEMWEMERRNRRSSNLPGKWFVYWSAGSCVLEDGPLMYEARGSV